MSIQLNHKALDMLPQTSEAINKADQANSDQMMMTALREILDLDTPLSDMNEEQLKEFDNFLIFAFRCKRLMR